MSAVSYKYVTKETTRHGRVAYYFRREGRRIRLPDDYGSERFGEAVRLAAVLDIGTTERKPNNQYIRNRNRIGAALAISIKGARKRAKAKGLGFDIDLDWAIEQVEAQNLRCALTGVPFYLSNTAASHRNPYAPSLDRIEAALGYTKRNVRIVVYAVNVMLLDWGHEIFENVVSGYRFTKGTKAKLLFPHLTGQFPHLKKSETLS